MESYTRDEILKSIGTEYEGLDDDLLLLILRNDIRSY